MSNNTYDTIIVGAGIAGLACGRQLEKKDQDFLVISKDIGGRILSSEDGTANYGAFFVCSDYENVLKFVKTKSRIKLRDFLFHTKDETYVLFQPRLLRYLLQFVKVESILFKFRNRLRKLRKTSTIISQKKAIENDSFLYDLYMKEAADFVNEKRLEPGTNQYLSKAIYSTTFSEISEMNAFSFLQFLLPLITPIYTFEFEKEKMIKPFKDKIKIDCVSDIQYKNGQYKLKTEDEIYTSKNIVLATEITWSKQYASINKINLPVKTNMIHLKGNLNTKYMTKRYHLFTPPGNVQAIANLQDGTYLFYYKNDESSISKYFENPKIIARKTWDPAGTINGHNLLECVRKNSMYIIGDYNIAGLEEAYITGLFCANEIDKLC
jgi:hypothetical protein